MESAPAWLEAALAGQVLDPETDSDEDDREGTLGFV